MLEELEDGPENLIARLEDLNKNLDREIDKLNRMIGDTGARGSTKYSDIASQLKANTQARASMARSSRRSLTSGTQDDGAMAFDINTDDSDQVCAGSLADTYINELQSQKICQGEDQSVAADEDELLSNCDLFR